MTISLTLTITLSHKC